MLKSEPCLAVVGGISNHRGWIGHLIRYRSIKGVDFLEYLKQVRGDTTEEKVLILDNASIHKTKTNLQYCQANNLTVLFNVPYCPQFQCVEFGW